MRVIEGALGRVWYLPEPYLVTQAKVTEYADALAYRSPDPKLAPPTFGAILSAKTWGLLFDEEDLDLRLDRTIQVDQRFTWGRPMRVGDQVITSVRVDAVRMRENSAFITVTAHSVTVEREFLCDDTSTLLHTWPAADGTAL